MLRNLGSSNKNYVRYGPKLFVFRRMCIYVLATTSLISCRQNPKTTIWEGDTKVGRIGLAITPTMPMIVKGPTIEVCFVLKSRELLVRGDSVVTGGVGARPEVFLTDKMGKVYLLAGYGSPLAEADSTTINNKPRENPRPNLHREGADLICMNHHFAVVTQGEYASMRLRFDKELEITRVTWWSGRLTPVL